MIQKLYVNNYKTLVNFEWYPDKINLLIGGNGAGKSTLFEVVKNLCSFIKGGENSSIHKLFMPDSLTAWQKGNTQTFELKLDVNSDIFYYKLIIEHRINERDMRVDTEELLCNGNLLLSVNKGEAKLYRDDGSKGPDYPSDWTRSSLPSIHSRHDNKKLTAFKKAIQHILVLQIIPSYMEDTSLEEQESPSKFFSNFVSWYRELSGNQKFASDFRNDLIDILDGFSHLQLEKEGIDARSLRFYFNFEGISQAQSISFKLSQLSDGQRMLVALYALLNAISSEHPYVLFLDEPDNFISLREVQPWLVSLESKVELGNLQTVLISHNTEIIDYLMMPGATNIKVYWFERVAGLQTRVRTIELDLENTLKPSELISRNWSL